MIGHSLAHYAITHELGRGGMGIVYRATDTKLNRDVALKILPAAALASEEDRARFFREAQSAAQLHHPNIATVFEIDESVLKDEGGNEVNATDGARPYIVMELIEGETLQEVIKQAPMKLADAVKVASQVAEALKAAHAKDIVHRDIKSANVMMTGDGIAKVLDFGLAKTNQSTMLTRMGSTLGTVAYMSPEQARGQEVDGRSDLYSLGTMLYEMVAGKLPYDGEYEQAVVYSILNEPPAPLTSVRTGVPMQLEWIVDKLLAKEADYRYQSAAGLLADLKTLDLSGSGQTRRSMTAASMQTMSATDQVVGLTEAPGRTLPWSLAAGLGVVALLLGFGLRGFWSGPAPVDEPLLRVEIPIPDMLGVGFPAMSPKKDFLAFVGGDITGQSGIYLRDMVTGEIRHIQGSSDAGKREIAFSPDGSRLAYTRSVNGGLVTVTVPSGLPEIRIDSMRFVFWKTDNQVLMVNDKRSAGQTYLYDLDTSELKEVELTGQTLGDGWVNVWKTHIPGTDIAYGHQLKRSITGGVDDGESKLMRSDLGAGSYTQMESPIMNPEYIAGGFLLYQQRDDNGLVVVRPVDSKSGDFTGPPVDALSESERTSWGRYSVTHEGDFLYVPGEPAILSGLAELIAVNLDKQATDIIPLLITAGDRIVDVSVSPSGDRIAMIVGPVGQPDNNVFLFDRSDESFSQLSFSNDARRVSWQNDEWVVFNRGVLEFAGTERINVKSGATEAIDAPWYIVDVAADGSFAVGFPTQIWGDFTRLSVVDLESGDVVNLDASQRDFFDAEIHPTQDLIVYDADGAGGPEIRIASKDGSRNWTLSNVQGFTPAWSDNGSSIWYASPGKIMQVPVRTRPSFAQIGSAQSKMDAPGLINFSVSEDGVFSAVQAGEVNLTDREVSFSTNIVWLQNWSSHLKKTFDQ